jgi:hypothetical protein
MNTVNWQQGLGIDQSAKANDYWNNGVWVLMPWSSDYDEFWVQVGTTIIEGLDTDTNIGIFTVGHPDVTGDSLTNPDTAPQFNKYWAPTDSLNCRSRYGQDDGTIGPLTSTGPANADMATGTPWEFHGVITLWFKKSTSKVVWYWKSCVESVNFVSGYGYWSLVDTMTCTIPSSVNYLNVCAQVDSKGSDTDQNAIKFIRAQYLG